MKKRKSAAWVVVLIYALMGVGMAMIYSVVSTKSSIVRVICEMFVSLIACMYAQALVHEAGHLVFGLMTGYRFRSFRVGGIMWLRTGGKIERRRLNLAGTGGQCLMSPPKGNENGISCGWYLMGGAAMDLLSALLALALYVTVRPNTVLSRFLLTWTLTGAASALTNGIPLHMALVDNDGCTARAVCASREAKHAFLVQMRINDFLSLGGRMRDVPTECLPEENDITNPMTAVLAVLSVNRLMDERYFDTARTEMDRLLAADSAIVGLHLHLMICDRLYLAMLGGEKDCIDEFWTPAHLNFMKQMRTNPSVLRTQYTYALLIEKDFAKANAYLAQFENEAKRYPYPGEIAGEREMIELAKTLTE